MDIFEHADVYTPSRAILQEEEEAAASSSSDYLRPAVCVWNKALQRRVYPQGLRCKVLVIATCPSSCAVINALPNKLLLGTIITPGVPFTNAVCLEPQPGDATCCVHALPDASCDALLVCCSHPVARERAGAWARAVLGQVAFDHLLVVGTIPAEQFRGQGDPSQEDLLFLLRTSTAAASASGPPPVPLLPTGTLLGGLPAALLSHCQVRGLSAELLVAVEMVPEARPALALAAATAAQSLLAARGATGVAAAVGGEEVCRELRKAAGAAAARAALEVFI